MMSRRWRWGGIGLGLAFYNDAAPMALDTAATKNPAGEPAGL